jgi:hypothetical protein
MPLQSQHEIKKQSSSYDEAKLKINERIHIKDSSLAPEKQFEPWISRDSLDLKMPNEASFSERYFFSLFKID